jgi:hypothetical protein
LAALSCAAAAAWPPDKVCGGCAPPVLDGPGAAWPLPRPAAAAGVDGGFGVGDAAAGGPPKGWLLIASCLPALLPPLLLLLPGACSSAPSSSWYPSGSWDVPPPLLLGLAAAGAAVLRLAAAPAPCPRLAGAPATPAPPSPAPAPMSPPPLLLPSPWRVQASGGRRYSRMVEGGTW